MVAPPSTTLTRHRAAVSTSPTLRQVPAPGESGTTKSPGARGGLWASPSSGPAAPTASTTPTPSFPGVAGGRRAPGYVPSTTFTSLQFTGASSHRTRVVPGGGGRVCGCWGTRSRAVSGGPCVA